MKWYYLVLFLFVFLLFSVIIGYFVYSFLSNNKNFYKPEVNYVDPMTGEKGYLVKEELPPLGENNFSYYFDVYLLPDAIAFCNNYSDLENNAKNIEVKEIVLDKEIEYFHLDPKNYSVGKCVVYVPEEKSPYREHLLKIRSRFLDSKIIFNFHIKNGTLEYIEYINKTTSLGEIAVYSSHPVYVRYVSNE